MSSPPLTKIAVVGLPTALNKRLKSYLNKAGALPWDEQCSVVFIPSSDAARVSVNQYVLDAALDSLQAGWTRALFFRPSVREHQDRIRTLYPFFRWRWLSNELLGFFPNQIDEFCRSLSADLSVEVEWAKAIQPCDHRSALLLPETSFGVMPDLERIWKMAAEAAGDHQIAGVRNALERFGEVHWTPLASGSRGWVDTRRIVFDISGERHGQAPFPRNWKFSLELERGFHFDVSSTLKRDFTLIDSSGASHRCAGNAYLNVDPHGVVRTVA